MKKTKHIVKVVKGSEIIHTEETGLMYDSIIKANIISNELLNKYPGWDVVVEEIK